MLPKTNLTNFLHKLWIMYIEDYIQEDRHLRISPVGHTINLAFGSPRIDCTRCPEWLCMGHLQSVGPWSKKAPIDVPKKLIHSIHISFVRSGPVSDLSS